MSRYPPKGLTVGGRVPNPRRNIAQGTVSSAQDSRRMRMLYVVRRGIRDAVEQEGHLDLETTDLRTFVQLHPGGGPDGNEDLFHYFGTLDVHKVNDTEVANELKADILYYLKEHDCRP